jgi:hypothetical protein
MALHRKDVHEQENPSDATLQRDQLWEFLTEQDAAEDQVTLQPAQTLRASYVEAVLLDPDGNPTSTKRVLFP